MPKEISTNKREDSDEDVAPEEEELLNLSNGAKKDDHQNESYHRDGDVTPEEEESIDLSEDSDGGGTLEEDPINLSNLINIEQFLGDEPPDPPKPRVTMQKVSQKLKKLKPRVVIQKVSQKLKKLKCTPKKKKICGRVVLMVLIPVVIGVVITAIILSQKQVHNMLDKMDENINPCDDFWLYSCGRYMEQHVPVKSARYIRERHVKADMQHTTEEEVIRLLEDQTTTSDIEPVKMVKKLYSSCRNQENIYKTIHPYFLELSEELGGIPIITRQPYSRNQAINLGTYYRLTGHIPWITYVMFNNYKNNRTIIKLKLTGGCHIDSILNTILFIRSLFPESVIQTDNILKFCKKLSEISYYSQNDDVFSDNLYSVSQIKHFLSGFDLVSIFNDTLTVSNETISSFSFMINNIAIFLKFNNLVLETETTDFMNILFLEAVQNFDGVIPKTSGDATANNDNISSLLEPLRKKSCLYGAYWAEDVLGWMYSEKHFDKKKVNKVNSIVQYLKKAMKYVLSQTDWLDEKSKKQALKKMENLATRIYIGHPQLARRTELIENYRNVKLTDNFFTNTVILRRKYHELLVKKMLKNDLKSVTDNQINAAYDPVSDSITIPIALLQPPMIYKEVPMAKFGGLGTLIGHEIFHAFGVNDVNFQFNDQWLSTDSLNKYEDLKKTVVETYSKYRVESMNATVDGSMTFEENIADIGGLKIAYKAYLLWKSKNRRVDVHPYGITSTDLQQFFIAFAQTWCSGEKSLAKGIHAPDEARVQVPLQNSKDFAEAFNCQRVSNMNPHPKIEPWG